MRTAAHVIAMVVSLAAGARADEPPQAPPASASPLVTDSESLEKAKALVPKFQVSTSKHYVLLSDAPGEEIQKVIGLLESTHDAFHANCRRLKLEPKPLRHKLVALLFRDKTAFAAFAKANDGMERTWAAGYYVPGPDRLVIFDAFSSPGVQKTMAKLAANERKVRAAPSAGQKQQLLDQIRDQKSDFIEDVEDNFCGTVAHEAAHQLFFHTGIQNPHVPYPRWLAEGLATAFEADDLSDASMGFFADNDRRKAAVRAAAAGDRLVPLQLLVTQDRFGLGGGSTQKGELADFYGQAHAVTVWMARFRPTELRLYLDALREGLHAVPSKRQPLFESIFGPVAVLERVWLRAESRVWPGMMETPWGRKLQDYEQHGPPDGEKAAHAAQHAHDDHAAASKGSGVSAGTPSTPPAPAPPTGEKPAATEPAPAAPSVP